ncbi:MAG: YjjG family noncanonical pyrimidine nucleotidase [Lachnospiraceae bacterium]|nr:YjjG family noncanonical pyrimidine nucleotidase [Lachnospiraceae bacterium]
MIRNIFLDLDDTILDFHKAEHIAVQRALRELDIEATPELLSRYSQLNDQQWKLLELGKLTREEVKVRRYRLLFQELGLDASWEMAARLYEGFLSQGHFFLDGAEELLRQLFPSYRLYLASNGTASVQRGRLKSARIGNYFDQIFISEEIGYHKPNRDFFEYCFQQIPDFKSEESLIVGDSLTSDIKGGINAGITTVWFCRDEEQARRSAEAYPQIRPDYVVHELREVCSLVQALTDRSAPPRTASAPPQAAAKTGCTIRQKIVQ